MTTTLETLDNALASAKATLKTASTTLRQARNAWTSACHQLKIQLHPTVGRRGIPHLDGYVDGYVAGLTTADLPYLADTLISATDAYNTAQANVNSAQAALNNALNSSKITM
jgi:hypothetical protein